MYIDYQPVEFEIKENTLKINDKIVNAYEYAGNLEQGFRFAYEKVLTDKAITEMLEAFYDTGARVILRHTQQYSMYRFLSWHPDYVGERKRRAQLLQVMHREGETETQKKYMIMKYRICWKMIFHAFIQRVGNAVFTPEMGKV